MSVTKSSAPARKRTVAPKRRAIGGQPPLPEFTPPADDAVEDVVVDERLRIDGLLVVETHRPQNLPNAPYNLLKLTLEDGSHRWQCIDCPDMVTTSREDVRKHRRLMHPPPKEISRVSQAAMAMTLSQIIQAAESSLSYGGLIERLEADRDRAREELTVMTRKYNALTRALEKAGFTPKIEED